MKKIMVKKTIERNFEELENLIGIDLHSKKDPFKIEVKKKQRS